LQNCLTTYDAACDIIESHWAFRSKIISAFFEKCEEGRTLRRERDDLRFKLDEERKLCTLYKKELERIKKEYGFYRTVDPIK
jgi:hypothetical protein